MSVLDDLEFDFDIVNDSSDFVPANYFRIYISEDTIVDLADDDLIRSSTEVENAGGNTVFRSETPGVPDCLANGNYYLLIEVDMHEDVSESGEDNNVVHNAVLNGTIAAITFAKFINAIAFTGGTIIFLIRF